MTEIAESLTEEEIKNNYSLDITVKAEINKPVIFEMNTKNYVKGVF